MVLQLGAGALGQDVDLEGEGVDRLAQAADLGRGDPRLRQPSHPQQIDKIGGVAFVVLHPSVREYLNSQRMRQVHRGAGLGEHISSPIPAVGGFQHPSGLSPTEELCGTGGVTSVVRAEVNGFVVHHGYSQDRA